MFNIFLLIPYIFEGMSDELTRWFQGNPTIEGVQNVTNVVPYALMVFILGMLFYGYKVYRYYTDYPRTDYRIEGTTVIEWMGHRNFKVNLCRLKHPLDPEVLDTLKDWFTIEGKDATQGIEMLIDMVKKREIFLYIGKVLEWGDAMRLKNRNDIWFLTTADIPDEKNSWFDTKGDFSVHSPVMREKLRHIWCFEDSSLKEIESVDGNMRNIFVLYPIPRVGEGESIDIGIDSELLESKRHTLIVKTIRNVDSLIKILPFLLPTKELANMVREKDLSLSVFRGKMKEKDTKIREEQSDNDELRILASEKELVGDPRPAGAKPKPFNLIWLVIFAGAVWFGSKLPSSVDALRGINPDLTIFMSFMVAGLLFWFFEMRNKEEKNIEAL